jgi:ubiquinone/menaquinone biosynthesis C-methylase UbiE
MKEITKTISRAKGQLEDFYDGWSDKSVDDIEHDIASSIRKAKTLSDAFDRKSQKDNLELNKILDFGCGFGQFIVSFSNFNKNTRMFYGCDYSKESIEYAQSNFEDSDHHFFLCRVWIWT